MQADKLHLLVLCGLPFCAGFVLADGHSHSHARVLSVVLLFHEVAAHTSPCFMAFGLCWIVAHAGHQLLLDCLPECCTCEHAAKVYVCYTGTSDAMHAPITQVPSTVDAHDSHFGAAAVQDANDAPAIFGGDNA